MTIDMIVRKLGTHRLVALAVALVLSLAAIWFVVQGGRNPLAAQTLQGHTVSSINELNAALRRATNGSVIRLMPGTYPPGLVKGIKIAGTATITSADPTNPARLESLTLRDCSGLRLQDLLVLARYSGPGTRVGLLVWQSRDILVDRLRFEGPAGGVDANVIAAFMIRASQQVTLSNSRFSGFWHGASVLGVSDVAILRNEFNAMRTDSIRGGGVERIIISGNVMTDYSPVAGDHVDGIQLWSTDQTKPGRDIVIKDNLVSRGYGQPTQGVFVRDTHRMLPFENVEISGNLVIGGLYNGITLDGAINAQISNNEVISFPDKDSWIRVERGNNVQVRGNSAIRYVISSQPAFVQADNRINKANATSPDKAVRAWLAARPELARNPGPLLQRLSQPANSR